MKKDNILKRLCAGMLGILCGVVLASSEASGEGKRTEEAKVILSEEEQAFIEAKEEVIIGCPAGNCPLVFQEEETGEIKGITIDILNMISEATGLRFRYEALPQGEVTYALLQELDVDMVASVEYNEINAQSPGIAMTKPYLHAEKMFVCKKGVLFGADNEMVIGVVSGSQTLAKIIRKQYPKFEVAYYDSTEEALSAILSGEVDAVLQNQYSLERILAKPLYEDLQIVAAASIGDSHCLASLVPVGEDTQPVVLEETACLLSILNKGIESLDEGDVSFAIIKETAEHPYELTAGDMLYRYRGTVIVVVVSFLVIGILLWRNYVLRKRRSEQEAVEQRARELAVINGHMQEQQLLLMDALERAKEGNRAKTSFLFNVSHDIRTPMNAILGFAEIARQNTDNKEKLTDSLEKIRQSGDHLLQLINDILDMSKIESGKVMLTEDLCNLIDSLTKVRDILQTEMHKKDLIFRLDISELENEWVYYDNLRVNQILFNLLSNATKFSRPGGEITVSLCQKESKIKGYAAYELHVRDTGIGMSKEFLSHIFEPFEREHTATVSKTQGTGLGMSITKNLVDLMGGTIAVQSESGKGTEFILNFMFKIQEDMEQTEERAAEKDLSEIDFSGRRLLLVEDNELNREIAEEILCAEGFAVETAENGQIAVDMVRNAAPGYYDGVLMDIQMPVMDGYEATREIRALETKELAEVPIIALTANAFNEDKKEALACGMDAHIAKPIHIGVLRETLVKVLK